MIEYVPILKGKPAEFSAWVNTSAAVRSGLTPLFEIAPANGLEEDLVKFTHRLNANAPAPGAVIAVDAGYLDRVTPIAGGADAAIAWSAHQLTASDYVVRPVVRISDPPSVLREAADVHAEHQAGVVIRLGGEEEDPDVGQIRTSVPVMLAAMGIATSDVHIVVDMFDLKDTRDVQRALPTAQACLDWTSANGPWASVTLASGAFPATVSHLDKASENRLPRLDAELWARVVAGRDEDIGFSDYAINHPALGGGGRAPLPSLRYTDGTDWVVWREAKARPGNESFFTVCEAVVSLPAFRGARFSWGDSEVERCSRSVGGAGTATQWRAYGTSHHLEVTVDRLATLGEP